MPASPVELRRDELYEQVWTTPMTHLARSLGLSDVGLKKICKKLDIPTPPVGYWAKLQHGHTLARTPLPPPKQDIPEKHVFYRSGEAEPSHGSERAEPPRETLELHPSIRVSAHLRAPHPLVARTRDGFKDTHPNRYARVSSRGADTLDVSVAPSSTNRALRILDALVRAAERSDFKVDVQKYKSYLVIRGERIRFALSEKMQRVKHQPVGKRSSWDPEWDYLPTGILRLEIKDDYWYHGRKLWQDSTKQKLEDLIGPFLSGAFDAALAAKERHRQWEEQEKRRQEEARRRQELERLRQLEEARRKDLEDQARRWQDSQMLLAYIQEVKNQASKRPLSDEERDRHDRWLTWALAHAERINPLSESLPFLHDSPAPAVSSHTRVL